MNTLKAFIKALLANLGLRELIDDTILYRFYLRLLIPAAYKMARNHEAFYRSMTDKHGVQSSVWFDIGANVGSKTAIFRQICHRVVAVEPDPNNFAVLKRRFVFSHRVQLIQAAVGEQTGNATLIRPGEDNGPYSTLSPKQLECLAQTREKTNSNCQHTRYEVAVTTLDQLIAKFGMPSYIKIDVEGFEKQVLQGLTNAVPWISFEANLPDFEEETVACLERYDSLVENAEYNFTVTEPPNGFASERWTSLQEICSLVHGSQLHYMELHCRQSR